MEFAPWGLRYFREFDHVGLYERLLGLSEPKLPVHQFTAAMGEVRRGKVSPATVAAAFQLDAAEQAETGTLSARFNDAPPLTSVELHEVLCLAEQGRAYGTVATLKTRLGV
jgi:hypothetical protein